MSTRPGAILDRDGTLIDVVRDEETGVVGVAFHPSQLRLLPGVVDGLQTLSTAGFSLAIATNQPGPAKGQFSAGTVERTNAALVAMLRDHGIAIDAVEACLHHPEGGPGGDAALARVCDCRKPAPGLLLAAMQRLALEPMRTWMIGDSLDDVRAARAANVRAGLVFATNRCELCPLRDGPGIVPDATAPRLDELARLIVAKPSQNR